MDPSSCLNCDIVQCLKNYDPDIRNCFCPRGNAKKLEDEMSYLRGQKEDVELKIRAQKERRPEVSPTSQVKSWIVNVGAIEEEVQKVRESLSTRKKSNCFLEFCSCFNYQLAENITDLRARILELKNGRTEFGDQLVHEDQGIEPVELQLRTDFSTIVGVEGKLREIQNHLEDPDVGIIGIYGAGGIGKTTILKEINNNYIERADHNFNLVIWVDVSREDPEVSIRTQIANRIGLPPPSPPLSIYNVLSKKKFLLLLDDVWEEVDIAAIGIPKPDNVNMGKIVLTTRSRKVCSAMGSRRNVKIDILDQKQSWDLFCQKIGPDAALNSSPIKELSKIVVSKCGGLPLALVTVGRALSDSTERSQWEEAIEHLNKAPDKIEGMDKFLLSSLKFSYDHLKSDQLRSCLLYCCLFPKNWEFDVDFFIPYWIGDGLIDADESNRDAYRSARNRGLNVIQELKSVCLLEAGNLGERYVKLHNSIRDMGMWITKSPPEKLMLYQRESKPKRILNIDEWEDASRISLIDSKFEGFGSDLVPRCINLSTLLMFKNQHLTDIPDNFFQYMHVLRVLDLSSTGLTRIPSSIASLVELQYLDIANTTIEELPKELRNLKKLRIFKLWSTLKLHVIPREAIIGLPRLLSLDMINCGYEWVGGQNLGIPDLKELTQLGNFGIDISKRTQVEEFLGSSLRSLSSLSLKLYGEHLTEDMISSIIKTVPNIKELAIVKCAQLKEFTFYRGSLSQLERLYLVGLEISSISWEDPNGVAEMSCLVFLVIGECDLLEEVSWVCQLPSLQILSISSCPKIQQVLRSSYEEVDKERCYFPKLAKLELINLPELRSISSHSLLLPSLYRLNVRECPQLKKLPLGPQSAEKLGGVIGEQEWWDALEWGPEDNNVIKTAFETRFIAGAN